MNNKTYWLVCYDIRDKKRLQKVHRYCKKVAMPLQYSVFVIPVDSLSEMKKIRMELKLIMDEKMDDIRFYYLPNVKHSIFLGTCNLPGIIGDGILTIY